ncbi:MAG: nuclear transport factor 2 family protein [Chloroflexi bacterium]|nr:nuclear transport factor 2 family protein [Chloroflexota bacterium]MYF23497.1 nuclear transport factor 2 family protein [Chloroflexota bacterium]
MADKAADKANADGQQDHRAVLEANRAFYEAFNDRDVEAMADLWLRSDEVTCIHPHRNVTIGHADVQRTWRAILTNPDQPKIVFAAEEAQVVGDIGIVAGREVVAGIPIVATNIYQRSQSADLTDNADTPGDTWLLIHHHGSPVLHTD